MNVQGVITHVTRGEVVSIKGKWMGKTGHGQFLERQ